MPFKRRHESSFERKYRPIIVHESLWGGYSPMKPDEGGWGWMFSRVLL